MITGSGKGGGRDISFFAVHTVRRGAGTAAGRRVRSGQGRKVCQVCHRVDV